jgi:hypothetical protein
MGVPHYGKEKIADALILPVIVATGRGTTAGLMLTRLTKEGFIV